MSTTAMPLEDLPIVNYFFVNGTGKHIDECFAKVFDQAEAGGADVLVAVNVSVLDGGYTHVYGTAVEFASDGQDEPS